MRNYIREELEDTYGILDLQEQLLSIMVYVDSFCSAHDIDYCLMAGSALGAERHQGYIPWDDDIDIYMTDAAYRKFKKIFDEEGNKEKYYIQEFGKTVYKNREMITMAKIKLNGSMIEEEAYKGWKIHQGLFVDIFIIHNLADSKIGRITQYIWSEAVVLKGLSVRGYKSKSFKDKMMLSIVKKIPTKWILKHGLFNAYRYDDKETSMLMGFIDTRNYSRAIFAKETIFPTKYCPFEKVELRIPAKNDQYLTVQFGKDYLTPPPIEKRPINKHAKSWKIDDGIHYEYSDEFKLI